MGMEMEGAFVIPADLTERLTTALARWDGRGPGEEDARYAGSELASAVMAVLLWNSQQ